MKKAIIVAVTGIGAMWCGAAQAEPARADMQNLARHDAPTGIKRTLAAFSLLNQDMAFSAYGRRRSADTSFIKSEMNHAIAMERVWEGYPQPPLYTVELSLAF